MRRNLCNFNVNSLIKPVVDEHRSRDKHLIKLVFVSVNYTEEFLQAVAGINKDEFKHLLMKELTSDDIPLKKLI